MAQTFDTSRVGGGTYELEQDASGNYKLKSVGFAQVNKLNLPDLATSDSPVKKILPVEEKKKIEVADPFKKLSAQNTSGGEGGGGGANQDYSGVMLKNPEVKDVSVKDAGESFSQEKYLQDREDTAEQNYDKAREALIASKGASPQIMAQARNKFNQANTDYMNALTAQGNFADPNVPDAIKTGQPSIEKVTGLQKIKSKATGLKADIASAVSNSPTFKVLSGAAKALGAVVTGLFGEESPTQKINKSYFNVRSDDSTGQRIAGNPAKDLYAGMNRNSAFGNLERAGNKRIEKREATIAKKGIKSKSNPKGVSQKFVDNTTNMKRQSVEYKAQKKGLSTKNPNEMRNIDKGGGDKGSDSGRVICTDLHRTGELSTRDWIRDTKFTFKTLSIKHVKGYLLWAEPTVKHMQKYPRYRKIWKHIAQHRANDIAWRLNEGKFDLLGRIYAGIGEPVCWALGNFVSDKQISKYNLTHWRRA